MKKYFGWFYNLSEREQKLVLFGAVAFVIAIFFFAVWSPMQQELERQKTALAADKNLLQWVDTQASKAIALRNSGNTTTRFSGSLTQLINTTARSNNIAITRIQPQGDNVQITVDSTQFNDYLNWVSNIEQQGAKVLYTDIADTDLPGYVQIRRLQVGAE